MTTDGLHWPHTVENVDTVKLLIERGAPIDAKDESYGGTPWVGAITLGETPQERHTGFVLRGGRAGWPAPAQTGPEVV